MAQPQKDAAMVRRKLRRNNVAVLGLARIRNAVRKASDQDDPSGCVRRYVELPSTDSNAPRLVG
jgi:hypothetical protein